MTIALPDMAAGEMSEDDLAQVSGGTITIVSCTYICSEAIDTGKQVVPHVRCSAEHGE